MAEANAIPLNPSLELAPMRSTDEVDVYEIGYDSLDGLRIAGWYCVPKASLIAPPYPALLLMPGYISEPTLPKSWAELGYAAVGVAPRGKLRSNGRFNPGYPGLLVNNIVDRHTYGYRGFYVDACRAVEFVQGRPEVDGSRIGVHGGSQGGALTITTAALRPDAITCGAAGAPYLCGFMDSAALTHSWPYEEINDYLRLHPERAEQVRETVSYYDGINFASNITCPMLINIGLGDDVCPPETGYALVNAMTGPVELDAYADCAHDAGGACGHQAKVEAFLAEQLRPATPAGRWRGFSPPRPTRPADFDAYWDAVDDELAQYPAAPEMDLLPLRSSETTTVYTMRLTSIGPYRIFGYYSVPNGPGPFPALLYTPRYGSVNNPAHLDDRERYAVLVLMHRGQRLADQPYAAAYPGLLTEGIADPATYIYRAIVADCLRGLEFLRARPEVDPDRVAIAGDDLALITAARRPGLRAAQLTGSMLYRLADARLGSTAYPVEEVNDYLRAQPEQRAAVERTLAYVDPLHHAPRITAPTATQITAGQGGIGGPEWMQPLIEAIAGPVDTYQLTNKGGIDHDERETWLAGQLGVAPRPRLWAVS